MLHGAVHLAVARPRRRVAHRRQRPRPRCPASCACSPPPTCPASSASGLIHKDWPVFIPEGGRTSYLGDVLAFVVAEDRETARAAAQLVEVEYRPLRRSPIRSPRSHDAEDAVWELDGNVLSRSAYARGDVDAALGGERARRARGVPDPAHRARVPRARVDARRAGSCPTGRGLHDVLRAARACGTTATRSRRCSASTRSASPSSWSRTAARSAARRTWRTRRRPRSPRSSSARPVKCTLSREESLLIHPKRHPIRIDSGSAATTTDGSPRCGRAWSATPGPYASVGMKVLERAAGHASGPYLVPDDRRRGVRGPHEQLGVRRVPRLRREPGAVRDGGRARPARRARSASAAGRSAPATSSTPGAVWGPGQIMDDGCRGARACLDAIKPAYDAAVASGAAVGLGLGLKNSGLGNGFLEIARAVVRFEDDGTVEVRHCWTEMGQGVHTVAAQVAIEELGVDPERVRVRRRHDARARRGPDDRQSRHADGRGRGRPRARRRCADGCQPGVDYEGEYRVDWTSSIAEGLEQPGDPLGVRLRRRSSSSIDRESGDVEQVVAAHDVGPRGQPAAVRRPDRGRGAHGSRLRADRGLPVRRRRPADDHDAAQPRHHPGQGRAADRGDPRRGAAAERAVRHQGRRRDRPRADRRARSPPRCTTSTASGGPRCRCAARRRADADE